MPVIIALSLDIPRDGIQKKIASVVVGATNPDTVTGLGAVMADAVKLKFIPAPLSEDRLRELVQIPDR